jgi:hypothetical protein
MAERVSRWTTNGKASEVAAEAVPLEELIRQRAYQLYLERENGLGDALGDWLEAEREACGR